jgi:hypothetical protein
MGWRRGVFWDIQELAAWCLALVVNFICVGVKQGTG